MTEEDIKKALEVCTNIYCTCDDRPYDDVRNCSDTLKNDARELITEQEEEIERLKTTLGQCNTELNSALESLKSQCREIGELKAEVKQAQVDTINTIVEYCENPSHWNELKDCKLWGGKSDDLRFFLNGIFKEVENE